MSQKLTLALLIMAALLSAVSGHQYCPDGTLTLTNTVTQSANIQNFQYFSYYLNPSSKESAPILVKKSAADQSYKFIIPQSSNGPFFQVECSNTATDTYVALRGQYLILKTAAGALNLWIYGSTPLQAFPITYKVGGNAVTIKSINSLSLTTQGASPGLQVAVTLSQNQQMFTGTLASNGVITKVGGYKSDAKLQKFDQYRSLKDIIYNLQDTSFYTISNSGQFTKITAEKQLGTLTNPKKIKVFPLRDYKGVVTQSNDAQTSGDIWTIVSGEATAQPTFEIASAAASTTAFKYYSDGLNNFARLSSKRIDWMVLSSATTPEFWKATLQQTSTPPTLNVDTATIQNIGFSRNKMSLITVAGAPPVTKITTYRMFGDNKYEIQYTKELSTSLDFTASPYQVVITPQCTTCSSIKIFTCFSQTLKCYIINKAVSVCKIRQDPASAWTA